MNRASKSSHRNEEELAAMQANLEQEFKNRLTQLSGEWNAERERLTAELAHRTQTAAQWEVERARLHAEVERLSRAQSAAQMEAERARAAMHQTIAAQSNSSAVEAMKEIARIEAAIQEISALVEDPATDLSTVVQKNVERAELESYLRGIQFALNNRGQ